MMMPSMKDVLRLTKAGRVGEATALLRDGLMERQVGPRRTPSDGGTSARPQAPAVLDLVPPKRDGGAWTAPHGAVEPSGLMPSASFAWHTVSNAAGSRRYKLYVPTDLAPTPRPLLVMLHGCTQSPDDFAAGTRMNDLADEAGLIVAYPEQRASDNRSKCWNWFKPKDQRRGSGEASLLADVVADVARTCSIDARRVCVAGLSAGGAAAAILAREYPDVFRGVGIHSGLACGAARDLPSALAAMKQGAPARGSATIQVPTIVFHGTADRTVDPSNARHVLADAIVGLGAPTLERGTAVGGAAYARELWRDAQGCVRAESWTIERAGHAWSGGSPTGSYTDPRGPDASREMVRFFMALERP